MRSLIINSLTLFDSNVSSAVGFSITNHSGSTRKKLIDHITTEVIKVLLFGDLVKSKSSILSGLQTLPFVTMMQLESVCNCLIPLYRQYCDEQYIDLRIQQLSNQNYLLQN